LPLENFKANPGDILYMKYLIFLIALIASLTFKELTTCVNGIDTKKCSADKVCIRYVRDFN